MSRKLEAHREVWNRKRILREAYIDWYNDILRDLSKVDGITVEVGGGGGNFKQFKADVVTTDIEFCPWLDLCCDARALPFKCNSLSNIVLIDVFHHLSDPITFLKEASRVLKLGGKVLMVEPYPSLFSCVVYRLFHPEPMRMDIDYFREIPVGKKDPWDSNQAIPYLIFFKGRDKFVEFFAEQFEIVKRQRMSIALYPASGGFERKSLVPDVVIPLLQSMEKFLSPLASLLAFRCYVILKKR